MCYLHYDDPQPGDTLPAYVARLAAGIDQTQPFAAVGLSLGGIMATAIAKISCPVKTVLISSVYSCEQLPPYFRLAQQLPVHRLMPPAFLKLTATCKHLLLTKGRENKRPMQRIIADGNNRFIS